MTLDDVQFLDSSRSNSAVPNHSLLQKISASTAPVGFERVVLFLYLVVFR